MIIPGERAGKAVWAGSGTREGCDGGMACRRRGEEDRRVRASTVGERLDAAGWNLPRKKEGEAKWSSI